MITIPGRIPITIQPFFWLLALFIGYMSTFTLAGTLLSVVVILYSVLFHEFGHALTGVLFGQKTRIELAAFGGFTYREGRKLKLWEEFFVVFNGPFFGLLLFAIASLSLHYFTITNPSLLFMVKFTALANLFWTIVNLVPVLPLDGGHLMSIILQAIFGFKGIKMAIFVGLIVGALMSIFFFVIGQFLVGAIFSILTFESFRSLRYYKMLTEKDQEPGFQDIFQKGLGDVAKGNESAALEKFERVREGTKEGVLYLSATEEMAKIYRRQGKYKEAFDLLLPVEKKLSPETLPLFHHLSYKNQDYDLVIKHAKEAFQLNPSYETALFNALAYGAKGKREAALGWLECSIREGLPKISEVLNKEELKSYRNDPQFQSLAHAKP